MKPIEYRTCPYCCGGGVVCCALCGDYRVVPKQLEDEYIKKRRWDVEDKIALREKYKTITVLKSDIDTRRAKVRALVEAVTPYIIIDRCSNPIRERVPDVRYKEYWKLYDCGNCQYCRAKAALAALESDNE